MSANMFSQRALQLTARRLAATNTSTLSKTTTLTRLSAPAAIATGRHVQYRPAATTTISPTSGNDILSAQRKHRPVSPHLTIYKPQITWVGSMSNRITGVALSGGMYLFGLAYLVAPTLGWHLESASIAAAVASWPILVKIMLKTTCAFPLTYHTFKGIQHLVWDMGAAFTNRQVIVGGWAVVGLASVSALGLAFY